MSKLVALLAILLIATGALLLAVPREEPSATRSLAPDSIAMPALVVRAREIAETVQAPLSIAFGLISLYWNRKNYLKQQGRG
jgi:hypothetical protein